MADTGDRPIPLILSEEPVGRRISRGGPIRPGTALVLATGDGKVVTLDRRPTISESALSIYRTQCIVDMTDHHSRIPESLPSLEDVFFFEAELDVWWRVSDPGEVVRRRIADGLEVCRSHLLEVIRPITRRFPIEQPRRAEEEVNNHLRGQDVVFPEGITVFRLIARLAPDRGTRAWRQEIATESRAEHRKAVQWAGERQQAEHENDLAGIKQQGNIAREHERIEAMRAAVNGDDGLVLLHLSRHPDDTGGVLDALASSRHVDFDTRLRVFEKLIDAGLIQPADIDDIRERIISPAYGLTGPTPSLRSSSGAPRPEDDDRPSGRDNVSGWKPTKATPPPAAASSHEPHMESHPASTPERQAGEPKEEERPVDDSAGSSGANVVGWKPRRPRADRP